MTSAWLLIQESSHRKLLGIPVGRWAVFLALTLVGFLVLRVLVTAARSLAGAAVEALDFGVLRSAEGAGGRGVEGTVRLLALLLILVQLGVWGTGLIDTALHRGFRYANFTETAAQTAFGVVRLFALAALWTGVTILVLSAFGVEVTPLLAGLGVGGIAVGFALQKILGDIFCSVAIVLDRPFEVGDFIITGDHMGTVERIGVKTTRVRSLEGEQIIFPNSNLLDSRIRNCKRLVWASIGALPVCPGGDTRTEARAWGREAEDLVDRSASPWDDPARRPSRADTRRAWRRGLLGEEIRAVPRPGVTEAEFQAAAERLLGLAA